MAQTIADVVEQILRDCAASVRPWKPEQFRRPESLSLEQVETLAQQLTKMHLLEADPHEQGYRATTSAQMLLKDEKALQRFRRELTQGSKPKQPVWELSANPSPQEKSVFDTLHTQPQPIASRIIIGLNVAVFIFGLGLAVKAGQGANYLWGNQSQGTQVIFEQTGGLSIEAFQREGGWGWIRLLTACFVHIGILHIGMNMYALNILGRDVEWLWGRVRFLVIYFLSGLGGSCLALFISTSPQYGDHRGFAGASGAICGLLAAEVVWLFVNRKVLPERMVKAQGKAMGINVLLITFMSFLPGVSWSGHLGGALAGAAAAFLLHAHRFGRPALGWACLGALVLLPILMFAPLRPFSTDSQVYMVDPYRVHRESVHLYQPPGEDAIGLRNVLAEAPDKRDPAQVERLLKEIRPVIHDLRRASQQLENPATSPKGLSDEEREKGQRYFAEWARQFEKMETLLREGKPWPNTDKKELLQVFEGGPDWLNPEQAQKPK